MRIHTKKREDDKQSTCLIKPENVIKFEKYITTDWIVGVGKEEMPDLLNYLKLNPNFKKLSVGLKHDG